MVTSGADYGSCQRPLPAHIVIAVTSRVEMETDEWPDMYSRDPWEFFECVLVTVSVHTSSSRMRFMSHNWSATKQRLHPQCVAEISRYLVLSGDRIRQCETSSRSRHKDIDQCLLRPVYSDAIQLDVELSSVELSCVAINWPLVAISFCRHRSVPVPCENSSAETTVAKRGRNPVAGLWDLTEDYTDWTVWTLWLHLYWLSSRHVLHAFACIKCIKQIKCFCNTAQCTPGP